LVLADCGITRLPNLGCRDELASGTLLALLAEFETLPASVHVIYASRTNLAAKSRAMIDFLVEKTDRAWPPPTQHIAPVTIYCLIWATDFDPANMHRIK